jgi:hypothetical protein
MQTEDGTIVRNKGGVSAERIKNDPQFIRTRENQRDFGTAGKASKLLYSRSRDTVLLKADRKIFSRLQTVMFSSLKADQTNVRGSKKIMDGDLTMLRTFEFNRNAQLAKSFFGDITNTIERLTGEVKTVIPSFNPEDMMQMPPDTTHFRFVLGGLELDFVGEEYVRDRAYSAWIPWGNIPTAPITLAASLTPNNLLPIFQLVGVEYAVEDAGQKFPYKNGSFNAVTITKVDLP